MSLGFRLYFEDRTVYISRDSLNKHTLGDTTVYTAAVNDAKVTWCFTPYAGAS